MPAHARAQIRQAVIQALVAAATLAGSRVFAHAADPQRIDALPALQVDDAGEQQRIESMARPAPFVERTLRVRVTAQGLSVDQVDELLGQVEQVFASSQGFGLGKYNTPAGASDVDASGDLQRKAFARGQMFDIVYATTQADPWSVV